jgi:hypothetical protein
VTVRADVGGHGSSHGRDGQGTPPAPVTPAAARAAAAPSAGHGGASGLPLLGSASATDWIA